MLVRSYNIEKTAGMLAGVKAVKGNLQAGRVCVLVADGKTRSEDFVRQTITDAGFTFKSIESPAMVH